MRTILIAIIGYLILVSSAVAAAPSEAAYDAFFAALHQVESGGAPDGKATVGDNGRAIGPLQIWRAYHADARVPGDYARCNELGYSRKVAESYLKRYAAKAWETGDFETLAKVHNGGPRGASKPATEKYWQKVKKELSKKTVLVVGK